jgi:lysophospholipase L1-like esterase
VYRDRVFLPIWSTDVRRARPTGGCGRSTGAYGVRVARTLDAQLTNLACSGASFGEGIELDDRYDAARPDLVLVTAGANTVDFERAYAYCVLAARGVSEPDADRVVRSSSVPDALVTAARLGARRILGDAPASGDSACTADHPGAYLQESVLDRADEVGDDARALADAIRARGEALGAVPEIVFTTYPDPLPEAASSFARCPDGAGLGEDELAYMHDLFDALNDELRTALAEVPGVRVADPDPSFAGHRWCDRDPWVHGPSILVTDPSSRAPFHPTLAGQRAIADAVLAARTAVPGEWRGTV